MLTLCVGKFAALRVNLTHIAPTGWAAARSPLQRVRAELDEFDTKMHRAVAVSVSVPETDGGAVDSTTKVLDPL